MSAPSRRPRVARAAPLQVSSLSLKDTKLQRNNNSIDIEKHADLDRKHNRNQRRRSIRNMMQHNKNNNKNQLTIKTTTPTSSSLLLLAALVGVAAATLLSASLVDGRLTFEKMTNRDYSGINYYSVPNVSLFECLGWCKEELSCTSAVFSFVVNPFAALQETRCQLQNDTQARLSSSGYSVATPQRATNLYFFNKIELHSEHLCTRLWAFERFPGRRLRGVRDRPSFHAPTKEACQAACMNEQRFVCRSLEYNYPTQQCQLSGLDRRSPVVQQLAAASSQGNGAGPSGSADLVDAPGTDYFENACLLGDDICNESRVYDYAHVGLAPSRTAHFVELNYYPDKEMLVKSQAGCARACTVEHEFICRSILYRPTFKPGQPNCALYHLDQRTFPDGADTFSQSPIQPLLDSSESSAIYLEAICNDTVSTMPASATTITLPPPGITLVPSPTTPGAMSVHSTSGGGGSGGANDYTRVHFMNVSTASPFDEPPSRGSSAGTSAAAAAAAAAASLASTLSPIFASVTPSVSSSTTLRLPATSFNGYPPKNIVVEAPSSSSSSSSSGYPSSITINPGVGMDRAPPPSRIKIPSPPGAEVMLPQNIQIHPSGSHEQNCDSHGFCYDVGLKCTDTKMVVSVKTQRPFFGRIYALGRSETCNANIKNQNQFQLDMFLNGPECNTQSASGSYTNTIVLQHHNVVLTKADKVYHVRCTYETASRNVSFGMMPVKDMFEVDVADRNQETISITASSDAPLPKISIMTLEGKEASTVRIGDRLTFRIEIPDNTPYGIFARSCVAMAKDARSTFEIIDDAGCPVDHTIFPNFSPAPSGNALESQYEAFRFTESYGVIFQCNVKYCIGKCDPVNCGIGRDSVDSYGRRRKRSIGELEAKTNNTSDGSGKPLGDDMTLSREIVVLDMNNDASAGSPENPEKPQAHRRGSPSAGDSQPESASQADSATSGEASQDALAGEAASLGARHCISSNSLALLIVSVGLFFILYVCVVAFLFARRGDPKISHIKHQFH